MEGNNLTGNMFESTISQLTLSSS